MIMTILTSNVPSKSTYITTDNLNDYCNLDFGYNSDDTMIGTVRLGFLKKKL